MTKRRDVLKGIGSGVAVVSMGGVVSADDDTDDQGDGTTAEVRVGHLSPDAHDVDVYVGKNPDGDPNIGKLSYSDFAPDADGTYIDLEAGEYDIAVTPAGETEPQVIDVDDFELEANTDNTILAVGELNPENNEPEIKALPLVDNDDDETALPPADKTLLRAVHASPDAGTVDIALDGDVVLEGVEFTDASSYLEIEPGEDRELSVQKNGASVLDVKLTFEAGTKVSGYVIGNADTEKGDKDIDAVTTLDATSPAKGRGDDEDEEDDEEDDGKGDDNGRGGGRGND